ncbi:MAG: trehalose operon repressor [Sporolactobacillus sp.]
MQENKFSLIYHDLAQKIRHQDLATGSLLPTENELCELYQTSRETVRKALAMLVRHGYIHKIQGKGSVILDVSRFDFPVSGLTSFQELASHSDEPWETTVHRLVLMRPDNALKQLLTITEDQYLWKVIRSRKVAGETVILDTDYLLQDVIPMLTEDVCAHSIYAYIEDELNLKIGFAKKQITVEPVSQMDRQYLSIKAPTSIVVVRSLVYLDSTQLFQYTESRHRADKFRFVDFARREHV